MSQRSDRFRAAYGRYVQEVPRRCVFFGTTNRDEFLRDTTGNRCFWAVDVGVIQPTKNIWQDLDGEIDQLWAEAVMRWKIGENLHLLGDVEIASKVVQEAHREQSAKEGVIADFLEKLIPDNWSQWSLDKRLIFLHGDNKGVENLVKRNRVCALEVWCEAFGGQAKDFRQHEALEINSILRKIDGWEKSGKSANCGYCGRQRYYSRVGTE